MHITQEKPKVKAVVSCPEFSPLMAKLRELLPAAIYPMHATFFDSGQLCIEVPDGPLWHFALASHLDDPLLVIRAIRWHIGNFPNGDQCLPRYEVTQA